ncbi:MAG: hypothetical protein PHN82_08690 [bacterium]|nr:hypothetical protein [bacterium]
MKWPFGRRRGYIGGRIASIDERLGRIEAEIRRVERFLAHPRPDRRREEVTRTRLLGPTVLPESKKRFVSYLSTGSFQTIGLRKHEMRAARVKAVLMMASILLVAAILLYAFIIPLFRR